MHAPGCQVPLLLVLPNALIVGCFWEKVFMWEVHMLIQNRVSNADMFSACQDFMNYW